MTILEELNLLKSRKQELEKIRTTKTGKTIDEKLLFSDPSDEIFSIDSTLHNINGRIEYILSQATVDSLPQRWREADFNESITGWEKAKAFAEAFPNGGQGLLFQGGVGRGKTHLSAAIAKYVIENYHVPVTMMSYSEMLAKIRQNFDEDGREVDRLCNVPLLIIDDLGQEKWSEWNFETTFRIINSRYETRSPVIVTTNCTRMELISNVGEAVFSRLYEMTDRITVTGDDYRMR